MTEHRSLLPRTLFAFAALPGMVAFIIPLLLAPDSAPADGWRWPALLLVAVGSVLLLWCVRDFHVAGRGTLAPWTPPSRLVIVGLYRYSRNPMYVSVLTILVGWSLLFRDRTLLLYAILIALAFQLRIRFYEEPRLLASFGDDWLAYRRHVRRWL